MTPRELIVSVEARSDLLNRALYLQDQRGVDWALTWLMDIENWLERTASNGAVIGTELSRHAALRSFPYKKQGRVIAEFTETEMRVARVYFRGQDWSR